MSTAVLGGLGTTTVEGPKALPELPPIQIEQYDPITHGQSEPQNEPESVLVDSSIQVGGKAEIEALIDQYGDHIPQEEKMVLSAISLCESNYRQFDTEGNVLFSGAGTPDKGAFQINKVHWERVEELGIDLDTIEGNTEFAVLLYTEQGSGPWYPSQDCWDKPIPGWE